MQGQVRFERRCAQTMNKRAVAWLELLLASRYRTFHTDPEKETPLIGVPFLTLGLTHFRPQRKYGRLKCGFDHAMLRQLPTYAPPPPRSPGYESKAELPLSLSGPARLFRQWWVSTIA